MADVLDEVVADTINPDDVRRRVDDWARRLDRLYADIRRWLPSGWSASDGRPVNMHEELMRHVHIPARDLPTLVLSRQGTEPATLTPRGLWIVGTNGRVDFERGGHRYLLIDTADNFADPRWQVANARRRSDRVPLTSDWLAGVLD